jgi:hypothetical protein
MGENKGDNFVASPFGLRSLLRQSGTRALVRLGRPKAEALGYLEERQQQQQRQPQRNGNGNRNRRSLRDDNKNGNSEGKGKDEGKGKAKCGVLRSE